MRFGLTIVLLLLCFQAFTNSVYNKLVDVNKCWKEQKDIDYTSLPAYNNMSSEEWIKIHLSLVEKTLRARSTAHLSESQKQNRTRILDDLHQYWQAGRFPQNEDYSYRLPIFIDKHDNFCAVGYLVKASGHEDVSRMISEKTNLAYVREMKYPELFAWAKAYGFTVDELAWIQPTYAPQGDCAKVGKGTTGVVHELYVDNSTNTLYVGGNFANVDSTIVANNIASITESNNVYTWHNLGTGVNGPVYAIQKFGNNIYVAGSFTTAGGNGVNNVAYWDGNAWHNAGCIAGVVKDLIVYKGNLYAAGDFDVCAAMAEVNFAVWNGIAWQQVYGLNGHVNTMEVIDSFIYLGGAFDYNNDTVNAIKWDPNTGFQKFTNKLKNEVNDIDVYDDSVYVVCKRTSADTNLICNLRGNTWNNWQVYYSSYGTMSMNTMCRYYDMFLVGGNFYRNPTGPGYFFANSMVWWTGASAYYSTRQFLVDSAVNKMVVFNDQVFIGGKFKNSMTQKVNGIARYLSNLPFTLSLAGTGACSGIDGTATVTPKFGQGPYKYSWTNGDTLQTSTHLAPGKQVVTVTDKNGQIRKDSIIVNNTIIDTGLNKSGNMLIAKQAGKKYQWYNCDTKTLMTNDTLSTFTPTQTGNYALIIWMINCMDTTNCYQVTITGGSVNQLNGSMVQIYPNPVTDILRLTFNNTNAKVVLSLSDIAGRIVWTGSTNAKTFEIDMRDLANGIYTLSVKNEEGLNSYYKIIKN